MQDTPADPYRTLKWVVLHGTLGVRLLTAVLLAGGVLAAVLTGWLWAIPVVVALSALFHLLARCFVELVQVIVEMLVPK